MVGPPESPEGYTDYEPYNLPRTWLITLISITGIPYIVWLWYGVQPVIDIGLTELLDVSIAVVFGVTGGLFLHEGCHFYADRFLGYEPRYAFPNRVFVPNEPFETAESIFVLLIPQILTIAYLVLISLRPGDAILIMVVLVFGVNVVAGSQDFGWAIRRLTWPSGHLVLVTEDETTYVAFKD